VAAGKDQMVRQINAELGTSHPDSLSERGIATRWRPIARRVVMPNDDRNSPAPERLPIHLTWADEGPLNASVQAWPVSFIR